jgi:hypothetical protein
LGGKAIEGYLDMNIESGLTIDLNLQTINNVDERWHSIGMDNF